MFGCKVDQGCEHKLAKSRSTAGKTHGKAEPATEEVLDNIHGWQVHQAKAQASEEADGDVEDDDAGGGGELDVEGREEETGGGKENTSQCNLTVAVRG